MTLLNGRNVMRIDIYSYITVYFVHNASSLVQKYNFEYC